MQKRITYKTAVLDFSNFEKFGNFEIFFNIFHYFSKNPPKFQNFQKSGICVLEETLTNACTKCQVILFINAVFIAL